MHEHIESQKQYPITLYHRWAAAWSKRYFFSFHSLPSFPLYFVLSFRISSGNRPSCSVVSTCWQLCTQSLPY